MSPDITADATLAIVAEIPAGFIRNVMLANREALLATPLEYRATRLGALIQTRWEHLIIGPEAPNDMMKRVRRRLAALALSTVRWSEVAAPYVTDEELNREPLL